MAPRPDHAGVVVVGGGGVAPVVDPSALRYSRFIDGSKLLPMAG